MRAAGKAAGRSGMKVLMLNGSPDPYGCTYTALSEVGKILEENQISVEIFQLGASAVRDCIGCGRCTSEGCVFSDDGVNEFLTKAGHADAFVFGTPVYFAHPSGRILSFLDRAFYAGGEAFAFKPAAALASARRAGTSASLDVMNKYFAAYRMVTVGSTYWNGVHGSKAEDVYEDEEGMQTLRNLGRNMAWILNCIEAGRIAGFNPPSLERGFHTDFIQGER